MLRRCHDFLSPAIRQYIVATPFMEHAADFMLRKESIAADRCTMPGPYYAIGRIALPQFVWDVYRRARHYRGILIHCARMLMLYW